MRKPMTTVWTTLVISSMSSQAYEGNSCEVGLGGEALYAGELNKHLQVLRRLLEPSHKDCPRIDRGRD